MAAGLRSDASIGRHYTSIRNSWTIILARRWSAPIAITRQIAEGSGGNVRAALADLEMWAG